MVKIPQLNKQYPFFDDGKISPSRFYIAEVTRIITTKEAKNIMFERTNEDDIHVSMSLLDIWKEEVDSHRNSNSFSVLNKGSNGNAGSPWLYAEETDCFIECSIPDYDENKIYFARTVWGGWFSMDTAGWWMSGELDVELEKFNQYEELFPEEYWKHVDKFN